MRCISQAVCIVALVGCGQKPASSDVAKGGGSPEAGRLKYPQSVNPGDPENAVKDLKRIYWAMYEYRKKYKKLPLPHVLQDTSKELLPGVKLEPEDFENPDVQYSEFEPGQKPQQAYRFSYYPVEKPPPGSDRLKNVPESDWYKPIFPPKGEKTIWGTCRIYLRNNERIFPDGRRTYHYGGIQVVLWSDGTIEKVKPSQLLYEPVSEKMWHVYVPGRARIPKDLLPITKKWEEQNAKSPEPYITWDE